jgi:2-amino-4-hydroxy-6-hydroxymethyldihydropteridine diphosphokinase
VSLILATGANIGEPILQLREACTILSTHFNLRAQSRIYCSKAQDYCDQPDFFNQVLEFELPSSSAPEILRIVLETEKLLGRQRDIPRGPRLIDIDILFYATEKFNNHELEIPHPRLWHRSFVVKPLRELPYFDILKHHFNFPETFIEDALPFVEQKD